MNIRKNQIKYTEVALIGFVWLVLILTPILFKEDNNNSLLRTVVNQLEILIPLLILFLVNRFILVSRLLFKGKIKVYIAFLLGVIFFLALGSHIYDVNNIKPPPQKKTIQQNNEIRPPQDSPPVRKDPPGRPPPGQREPRPVPPFANFLIW